MEPDTHSTDGPATRRVRLHVAYHGGSFRGFARNEGVDTVEGILSAAITQIIGHQPTMSAAGRTDAGVHARMQVVSLDVPAESDLEDLARSLNSMCAPHIAVTSATWESADFDARASATSRMYRYSVLNRRTADPMLVDRAWHVREPLSLPLMNLACDAMMGEQDFSAFCRAPTTLPGRPAASLKRYVMEAWWSDNGDGTLTFQIRANAFCHQMVRSLVGFLVDVGARRRPPSDMRRVLLTRERSHGSRVAPPQGLTLWDVGYDGVRIHP